MTITVDTNAAGPHLFYESVKIVDLSRVIMSQTKATDSTRMPLINETAPDFTAETTQGTIRFHEWIGNG